MRVSLISRRMCYFLRRNTCKYSCFRIFEFAEYSSSLNIRVPQLFAFPEYSYSPNIRVPQLFAFSIYSCSPHWVFKIMSIFSYTLLPPGFLFAFKCFALKWSSSYLLTSCLIVSLHIMFISYGRIKQLYIIITRMWKISIKFSCLANVSQH